MRLYVEGGLPRDHDEVLGIGVDLLQHQTGRFAHEHRRNVDARIVFGRHRNQLIGVDIVDDDGVVAGGLAGADLLLERTVPDVVVPRHQNYPLAGLVLHVGRGRLQGARATVRGIGVHQNAADDCDKKSVSGERFKELRVYGGKYSEIDR